jgi:hypothetical protein
MLLNICRHLRLVLTIDLLHAINRMMVMLARLCASRTCTSRSRHGAIASNRVLPGAVETWQRTNSPATGLVARTAELLGEGTTSTQNGTLPVDDVHRNDQEQGDTEKDSRCIGEMVLAANVLEEGSCGESEYTGQEVTSPAVATSCGGTVGSVRANHVVDSGHVNGIVGNTDNGRADQRADPMNWWAGRGPSEDDETDWQARRGVEKPPETRLVLSLLITRAFASKPLVALDGGEEREPRDKVAYADTAECKTNSEGCKMPLFKHKRVRLQEHENDSIRETRKQGQDQDDGLGQEHAEWAHPSSQDLAWVKSLFESPELVWSPDVDRLAVLLAFLATLLRDPVHEDGCTSLGDDDGVGDLDGPAEDELDPDVPAPGEELFDEASDDGTED